ncbi:MAG: DEAD/DEAH box helicase [Pirellulales bacterium]|nr:DEAD/DEAH box helicase [Pirellulales bacterium]
MIHLPLFDTVADPLLGRFDPLVATWFRERFREPTEAQRLGWPAILAGQNTLIAAPTGSGKTLAAFLASIDRLIRQARARELPETTQVLYISPLKALGNDIHRNLEAPLGELQALAAARGEPLPAIRAMVRTGDTPSGLRQAMVRRPPHILVTTPESMYLLLTSVRGRELLRDVRTVIVDEIHALARDKRGSHLTLSLERLEALCPAPPVRIGLSATQRPMDDIARFLVGARRIAADGTPDCTIIDTGHLRELDLGIEVPPTELSAVCSHETWGEIYERLCQLINAHRSTLVFVNTRRMAERVAFRLGESLGEEAVASHHGSLSREIRLSAEERLKSGQLKAIVATASLEMGIDVGYIDLVCQLGTPRSIATLLQRVGRSGHALGATPKGRLLPLTRDELLENLATVAAVRSGRLDRIEIPTGPLDVLAQQIVAAAACDDWREDDLYGLFRGAWPYRELKREDFEAILAMLADGVARNSRRGAHLHRDRVNGRLRARRGARIAAITSGGTIPETGDYRVVLGEERTFVGTVNEDFALESLKGDVFLLGNTSWRIINVRGGEVLVEDAHGAPATIPFWLGEAPGRTLELSASVSSLREAIRDRIVWPADTEANVPLSSTNGQSQLGASWEEDGDPTDEAERVTALLDKPAVAPGVGIDCQPASSGTRDVTAAAVDERFAMPDLTGLGEPLAGEPDLRPARDWLIDACAASPWAGEQAARYVAAEVAAIGLVPTRQRIVFERFFDESGGMQLVIHAPLGARVNRAWGLALRKRFCRSFDFELQASADDEGIVLSLGPQHSFALDALFKMLTPANAEHLLVQALLAAPMFPTRWRWNVTRALAVLRQRGGTRVPPHMQRFQADDLLAAVFPQTVGCLENHSGDIEIPDHPLVRQTLDDCLREAMDIDTWIDVLGRIERHEIELVPRDTREPSPFCHERLNARPYAFLDDAPLEERRVRAISTPRGLRIADSADLTALDPAAIDQVVVDAWPTIRDADELHDALLSLVAMTPAEAADVRGWLDALVAEGRATRIERPTGDDWWIAAENWPLVRSLEPQAVARPAVSLPATVRSDWTSTEALVALVRGRLQVSGPRTADELGALVGLSESRVASALEALEGEGIAMRGQFRPASRGTSLVEWCERRLLARIHRLTLDGLRRQIEPIEPRDFLRFLVRHQHLSRDTRQHGPEGVRDAIGQLQGFELAAGVWESRVLPARVEGYAAQWLDGLSLSGELVWGRLRPPRRGADQAASSSGLTRAAAVSLVFREDLPWLLPAERDRAGEIPLRGAARQVLEVLGARGALFHHELRAATGLLPTQLDDALAELAAQGLVTADLFAAVRWMAAGNRAGRDRRMRRARRDAALTNNPARWKLAAGGPASSGRWSVFPGQIETPARSDIVLRWAWQLLRRWGIVFRDLLARESVAPRWGELVGTLRRLEARGEIRGGRFVSGVAGEQYALPAAVDELRRVRETTPGRRIVVVSAADPLNLVGIITPEPRVTATHTNTLALEDGRLLASKQARQITLHAEVEPPIAAELTRRLRRHAVAS